MPYYVYLPDGRDVEFPDEYPRAEAMQVARGMLNPRREAAPVAAAPTEERSLLGGALSRGYNTAQSSGGSALEGLGTVLGIESLRNYGAESRRRNQQEAEQAQPAERRATFENASSIGDYLRATGQAVAESLPSTGLGLAGGLAGGLLGSLAGPAGSVAGAMAGSSLASLPLFYGSNRQRQIEESTPRNAEGRPTGEGTVSSEGAAFGAAVPQAALEGVTDVLLGRLGRFFRGGAEEVGKSLLPRIATGIGVGAASEVPAEVLQQALERAQAGMELLSPEAYREYREATIAALAAGGTMGGAVSGALGQRPAPPKPREEEDEALRQHLETLALQRLAENAPQPPAPVAPQPEAVVPNANEVPVDNGVMARAAVAPTAPMAQQPPALAAPETPAQAAPEAAPIEAQAPVVPPPAAPVVAPVAPVEQAPIEPEVEAEATTQQEQEPFVENPAPAAATETPAPFGFRTAMGSTYVLHEDGTTTRTKAPRAAHPGDSGLKERSAATLFLDPQDIQRLSPPADQNWRIINHGDGTVSLAVQNQDGGWGISPSQRNVPVQNTPKTGLAPLELWKPEELYGLQAFRGMHPGNKITSLQPKPPGRMESPSEAAKPELVVAPDPAKVAEAQRYIAEQIERIRKTGKQGEKIASALEGVVQDQQNHPLQVYGAFVAGNAMAKVLPQGANHEINFTRELIKPELTEAEKKSAKESGIKEGEGGFGRRRAAKQIIEISLAPQALAHVNQTAAHEAFHVLQDYYAKFDPTFMKVANAAFTDDAPISSIDKSIRRKLENTNIPPSNILPMGGGYKTYWDALTGYLGDRKLSASEQQAYTYAALYDAAQFGTPMTGLKPSMTRFVNFLRDFFSNVRNALKGNGFNNASDLFSRAVERGGSRFSEDQILDAFKGAAENIQFAAAGGVGIKPGVPDVIVYDDVEGFDKQIIMMWDVNGGGSIYMNSLVKGDVIEIDAMYPVEYKKNPNVQKTSLPSPFNVKIEVGPAATRKMVDDLAIVLRQEAPRVGLITARRIGGARESLPEELQRINIRVPKVVTKKTAKVTPENKVQFAAAANSVNMTLPGFEKWFGDSKVVDESGGPTRVYTGSTVSNIREFDIKFASPESLFGRGFWFTDNPEVAGGIPKSASSLEEAYEKGELSKAGYAFQGRRTVIEAPNAGQTKEIKEYLSEFGEIFLGEKNSSELMKAINISPVEFANRFNDIYQKAPRYNNNRSRLDTFSNYLKDQLGLEVRRAGEATVYPVYLSIKNPFDIYSTFENPYVDGRLHDEEGNLLNKDAVDYVWKHWYEMFSRRKDWDINEYSKDFWRGLEIFFDQYGYGREKWLDKSSSKGFRAPINKDLYNFLEREAENINRKHGYDEHEKDTVNNALRRVGYDGIRTTSNDIPSRREEGWEKNKTTQPFVVWIAFDPKQIKSVFNKFAPDVGNESQFAAAANGATGGLPPVGQRVPPMTQAMANGTEMRIEYNAVAKAMGRRLSSLGWKAAPEKTERFFTMFQDHMLPLARMVDKVNAEGGNVSQAMNTYVQQDLISGRTADMLKKRNEKGGLYRNLIDGVADAKTFTPDEFENYVYARHATERNDQMASINPKFPDGGSGMSRKRAEEILKDFAKSGKIPELEKVAVFADAIVRDTNEVRVDSGLTPDFSKMTVDSEGRLIPKYQYYVPLKGFAEESVDADETINEFRPKGSRMLGAKGREDMQAKGRNRMAGDIVAHLIMQNTQAVVRSQKNAVGQSFLAMIRANPKQTEGIAEILARPMTRTAVVDGVVKVVPDIMYKNRPDILVVKEGGKETVVQIKDPAIARSMIGATTNSATTNSLLIRSLISLNNYLARINTAYNPEFMITNLPRDLATFGVNVAQFDVKGLRIASYKDTPSAMSGIRDVIRGTNNKPEMAASYRRLRELGGTNETYGFADIDTRIKEINETMAKIGAEAKSWKQMAGVFKPVIKFLEDYNTIVENGIRTSLFKNLVDRGINEQQAAYIAKNVTVNFTKGGENRVFMNAMYLFYNASLQGTMAMASAMVRSPKVRKIVAGIVVAGLVQDALNSMLSGEDDDGKKVYDKIPDHILKRSFILMDPFGMTERGYFSFPMPYGFNAFFNMGREMGRTSRGQREPMDAAANILGTFVDAFNPIGGGTNFFNFAAPTFADPLVDIMRNRDFADRPIIPERGGFGAQTPDSQKYWNNTFAPYVGIANFLNEVTGGTSVIPGAVDISPNMIQYLINFATGGVGKFVERTFNTATNTIPSALAGDMADLDVREVPILRALYGNVTTRNNMEDYMKHSQEVLQVRQEIRAANEVGDSERVAAAFERYPGQIEIMDSINKISRDRSKLTREINAISRNENIPADVKRDLIKQLRDQQNQLVSIANRLYNQRVTNRD
jgi:hypothetical protein